MRNGKTIGWLAISHSASKSYIDCLDNSASQSIKWKTHSHDQMLDIQPTLNVGYGFIIIRLIFFFFVNSALQIFHYYEGRFQYNSICTIYHGWEQGYRYACGTTIPTARQMLLDFCSCVWIIFIFRAVIALLPRR